MRVCMCFVVMMKFQLRVIEICRYFGLAEVLRFASDRKKVPRQCARDTRGQMVYANNYKFQEKPPLN